MKKSDIYGIIGSAVSCGIILLLLFLIMMPGVKQEEDEGIIVSFGDSFDGGGSSPATTVQAPQPVQPAESTPSSTTQETGRDEPDDVITQTDPSLEIAQRQEEERKQREAEQRRREEEQRRLAQEQQQAEERRLAELQRQEEQRRQREQEAIERANAMGNAFGTDASGSGSGTTQGDEQRGNPVGKGSSDGNSWSLDGRALVGKIATPSYTQNVEGMITVDIKVNEKGEVTAVSIGRPTNISNAEILNATREAARKTKFTAGKNIVSGTITYNFRLK